ncbi:MAG: hypothetical protein DMG52_10090 [Acidobacteria bacterium]|nr:MAG: hypothetical protein DMG52_10090 [Acidobacteriota bacterium]
MAHLAENFIGSSDEVGVGDRFGNRGRRSDSRFLCLYGDTTEEKDQAQIESAQPETGEFHVGGHMLCRIADSKLRRRTTAGTMYRAPTNIGSGE